MATDLVHEESFLDLLTRQRTRGEAGVRLSFHQDLTAPVSFCVSPLHYAAVTGNTELGCYLYSEGLHVHGKHITVASFAAGGRNGNTSWRIPVSVSAAQTASLAGHATTAKALKYFEKGIPLHWDRKLHDKFKNDEFKEKSRKQMRALLESDWFYALPGPARVRVVDKMMTDLARVHVWNFLDNRIWEGDWEAVLEEDVYNAVKAFDYERLNATLRLRGHRGNPQYQFNVGQVGNANRRREGGGLFKLVRSAAIGAGWWIIQKYQCGSSIPLLSAMGLFVASGFHMPLQLGLPIILSFMGSGADPSDSASSSSSSAKP